MGMAYDSLSNDRLAEMVAALTSLSPASAAEVVGSVDPEREEGERDWGRKWAIKLLESNSEHQRYQEDIDRRRGELRRAAAAY